MTQSRLERLEEYLGTGPEGAAYVLVDGGRYLSKQLKKLQILQATKGVSSKHTIDLANSLVAVQGILDRACEKVENSGQTFCTIKKPVTPYREAQRIAAGISPR